MLIEFIVLILPLYYCFFNFSFCGTRSLLKGNFPSPQRFFLSRPFTALRRRSILAGSRFAPAAGSSAFHRFALSTETLRPDLPAIAVRPWPLLTAATATPASPLTAALSASANSGSAPAPDWERAGARPRRAARRLGSSTGYASATIRGRARRPPAPLPQQAHFARGAAGARVPPSSSTAAAAAAASATPHPLSGSMARRVLARARARAPLVVGVLEIGQPARQVHVHVIPGRDEGPVTPAPSPSSPLQRPLRAMDPPTAGDAPAPASSSSSFASSGMSNAQARAGAGAGVSGTEMGISITVSEGGRTSALMGGAAAALGAVGVALDSALRRHRRVRRVRRNRLRRHGTLRAAAAAAAAAAASSATPAPLQVPALLPVVGVISIL